MDGDGKLDVAKSRPFSQAQINTLLHSKGDVSVPGFVLFDAEDEKAARLVRFDLDNEDGNAVNQTGGLTYLAGRRWLVSRPLDTADGTTASIRWVDPDGLREACTATASFAAVPGKGASCAHPACAEAAKQVAALRKQDSPGIDLEMPPRGTSSGAALPIDRIADAITQTDDWSDTLSGSGSYGPLVGVLDADNDGKPDVMELRVTILWGGQTSESTWRMWQWRQGKLSERNHPMAEQLNRLPGDADYEAAGLGGIARYLIYQGKTYWYFAGTKLQSGSAKSRTETVWVFLGHPSGLKPVGTIEQVSRIRSVTITPGKDLPKLR